MRLGEAESRRRSGFALFGGRCLCCPCREGGKLFVHFASREKLKKQKDSMKNPSGVLYGNNKIFSVPAIAKEDIIQKLGTWK